jgi:hypothetical protein
MSVPCPHCGASHPPDERFCASTGLPIGTPPAAPERGVWDLLQEAVAMYRRHARTFLMTAAVLMVPGSLVRSCATAALDNPLKEIDLTSEGGADAVAHVLGGGVTASVLEAAGWAVTAFILYGLVLPLTEGALTIAVADRVLGGTATWREHWMLLFRRLPLLLSALLPAALLVMIGSLLVIPGLVLSFFFTFAAPVVLIESAGGTAALKRSYALVRADWLRVALLLLTFGLLSGVAHWVASLFVPHRAVFFGSFLGDLLLLVVMPVPIIASVLLYFDLRRKVDGLTDDRLRAELESLRIST